MAVSSTVWLALLTLIFQCHPASSYPPSPEGPCDNRPCLNGGQCLDLSYPGGPPLFQCSCPSGFSGLTCQRQLDPCADEPCLNGGRCTARGDHFHCLCSSGYKGRVCDTPVNRRKPCASRPCGPHGICEMLDDDDFTCKCFPGYSGSRCQEADEDKEATKHIHHTVEVESLNVDGSTWVLKDILIVILIIVLLVSIVCCILCCHSARVWNRRSEMKCIQEARLAAGKRAPPVKGSWQISNEMCYEFFCCCCTNPFRKTYISELDYCDPCDDTREVLLPVKEYCDLLCQQNQPCYTADDVVAECTCHIHKPCIPECPSSGLVEHEVFKYPSWVDRSCNKVPSRGDRRSPGIAYPCVRDSPGVRHSSSAAHGCRRSSNPHLARGDCTCCAHVEQDGVCVDRDEE